MSDRQRELLGLLLLTLGILIFLSLISYNPGEEPTIAANVAIHNWMGVAGVIASSALVRYTIGYASIIIPILIMLYGFWILARKKFGPLLRFTACTLLLGVIAATVLGLPDAVRESGVSYEYRYSGLVGGVVARVCHDFLGLWGTLIVLTAGTVMVFRGYFSWSLYSPVELFAGHIEAAFRTIRGWWRAWLRSPEVEVHTPEDPSRTRSHVETDHAQRVLEKLRGDYQERSGARSDSMQEVPSARDMPPEEVKGTSELESSSPEVEEAPDQAEHPVDQSGQAYSMGKEVIEEEVDYDALRESVRRREYQLPSADLLIAPDEIEEGATREELVENADLLERSLKEFGVEAQVVHIAPGPIITRYELEPATGVRINKFTALADDLARVMRALRVRVLAPIPGKAAVGIEIPNKHGSTVYLKHIINSNAFTTREGMLNLAVGKTTSGEAYVTELSRMPHLLIAGATGSGKSVCINSMIISLLYQAKPHELKFVLIDPKKLELSVYQDLAGYHLITSEDIDEDVITTPKNAVTALRAVEIEMEHRYEVLADSTVRDIREYNRRVEEGEIEGDTLPYIVIVIDELADLMITAAKEVEEPISRLAQMARAVGIHLVIATQRPSVDVLTGVIKANFPARIAFQVASKTDSRTILDANGAEKLLGKGDMLFQPPAQPEPIRLHNAYVSLDEIEAVLEHINTQPKAHELELPTLTEASETTSFTVGDERDELFYQALKLVVTHQQGSISLLQRRLRIGYSRAARIMDQLEEAGIVGGHEGSKARDVLVDEAFIEQLEKGDVQV
ncbi:MAG TPA: DNA translocase FtsK [bacterium]|nr:DNA translocase FtsK [bacterium]